MSKNIDNKNYILFLPFIALLSNCAISEATINLFPILSGDEENNHLIETINLSNSSIDFEGLNQDMVDIVDDDIFQNHIEYSNDYKTALLFINGAFINTYISLKDFNEHQYYLDVSGIEKDAFNSQKRNAIFQSLNRFNSIVSENNSNLFDDFSKRENIEVNLEITVLNDSLIIENTLSALNLVFKAEEQFKGFLFMENLKPNLIEDDTLKMVTFDNQNEIEHYFKVDNNLSIDNERTLFENNYDYSIVDYRYENLDDFDAYNCD